MIERNVYDESADDELWLNVVNSLICNNNSLSAVMKVNNCDVCFHLNTAAKTNTNQKNYVRKEQVRPSSSTLSVDDSTPLEK